MSTKKTTIKRVRSCTCESFPFCEHVKNATVDPKDVLKHHVTGAIERGEATAIVGKTETIDITPNYSALTNRFLDSALGRYRGTATSLGNSAQLQVCREVHSIVSELNVAIHSLDTTEALEELRKRLSDACGEVNKKLQEVEY